MLINERFKSPNKEFEKVYAIFDKRDYFNNKGLAKTQIGNFKRALEKNDKGAQKLLDAHKGNMDSAISYIEEFISDGNKKKSFESFQEFSSMVNALEMSTKPNLKQKPAESIKRRIHNNSQKYSMALYSAIRKQKFNNYKDVHKDVDELTTKNESVEEATFRPNSGTMSGGVLQLDNKKYKLKRDVKGVQIGDYTNVILPKGTIIYNIPGGVFAHQDVLAAYQSGQNKYFNKPTFKGISIKRTKNTIMAIEKNSIVLESVNEASIKGKNNKTGESFGMVIGSDKKNKEGDFEVVVRKSYSSRISSYKFIFDENSELNRVVDYGYSMDGKFPDMKGSGSGTHIRPSKRETITQIAKVTSPAFAKKIYQHVTKVNESVNEGKKRFYQQDGIGRAKYTISYHDGKSKHKDGSDFYGIQILKNKKELEKFRNDLLKKGYREDRGFKKESVNEGKYNYKADALTAYFKGKIDAKELDKIARDDFKSGIATKKELSNFLSNKFTQDVMSDTYGIPSGTLIKRVRGLMKFAEGKESVNEAMKPSQVRSAISKVKKGLMRKWKQKGGYENFGQKELDKMKSKFDYNPYGSPDERQISKMLDGFDNWAMNYDGNMREDKSEIKGLVKKVGNNETKFYDVLSAMEKKYGKQKYRIWLEKSLKDFGVNSKHYDYRTNAGAEEKLFQLGK